MTSKTDQVVLITGGAKGIGRGISEVFLNAGATVIACGRSEPEALPAAKGQSAEFVSADIRDPEAASTLIENIISAQGRLDVLINNAGGSPFAMAADSSPRFAESLMRLNLLAPLHLSQLANAQMQKQDSGGVIVNICSVSGMRPSPGTSIYGAAKAGLLNLTQTLAVEWAPKVRVVAISPGLIRTEQSQLHYGDEDGIAAVSATVPLQRMGDPEEIGNACLWLASDAAGYASGSNLVLHGGGERPAFLDAATANQGEQN